MKHLIIALALILVGFTSRIMAVEVSGVCPKLANSSIVIGYRAEGILNQFIGLDTTYVDSDGQFRWHFNIDEIVCCRIPLGDTEATFFVEPNEKYVIHLPNFKSKTLEQRLNPFFNLESVPVFVEAGDTTELNNHWWFYEAVFSHAFQEAILSTLPGGGGVEPWKMRVDTLYQSYKNDLFQTHRKCRQETFIELTQPFLTQPDKMRRMNGIDVAFQSSAYWQLFNTRFETVWPDDGVTPNLIIQLAVSTDNLLPLQMDVVNNLGITNDTLAELVICKGLLDATVNYPKMTSGLIKLLEKASVSFKYEKTKFIADLIRIKLLKSHTGTAAPYFKLPEADGKLTPTVLEKSYVYLVFGNSKINQFERDLSLLDTYQKMFKRDLLVVPICMYQNASDIKQLQDQLNIKLPITYCEDADKLIKSYDITSYPYYVLIDREGLILKSPAPSPDEKFEDFFGQILIQEQSKRPDNNIFK